VVVTSQRLNRLLLPCTELHAAPLAPIQQQQHLFNNSKHLFFQSRDRCCRRNSLRLHGLPPRSKRVFDGQLRVVGLLLLLLLLLLHFHLML
jgi:hypothetical protein